MRRLFDTYLTNKFFILLLCLSCCCYSYCQVASKGCVTDTAGKSLTDTKGIDGSFAASLGYGKGETSDASFHVNYKKQNFSVSGSYSFLRTNQKQLLNYFRRATIGNHIQEYFLSQEGVSLQRNHNMQLSANYRLNHKTILNGLINGYDKRLSIDAVNNFKITNFLLTDTVIKLNNIKVDRWKHFLTNLNVQHNISNNQRLSLDANFLYFHNINPIQLKSEYFSKENDYLFSSRLRSNKKTIIRSWVLSGNYSAKLNDKLLIELGAKASTLKFQNDLVVEKFNNGDWLKEVTSSPAHFLLEKIGVAYSTIDYHRDSTIVIKGGLKFEYTQTNLRDNENKSLINRKYGRLFPSLLVTRTLSKGQSVFVSYNSGTTRPTFNDITRYIFFLEPGKLISGNPSLQPASFYSVKAGYTEKKYSLSLFYNHENGTIAWSQNLKQFRSIGLSATVPAKIKTWWTMHHSIIATRQIVSGFCDGLLLKKHNANIQFTAKHQFVFPHSWNVELSGSYQSETLSGLFLMHSLGSLNADVKKKIGKGTLTISAKDIFATNKMRIYSSRPEIKQSMGLFLYATPRTFRISYAINFSKNQTQKTTNRNTGSEEQQARIK